MTPPSGRLAGLCPTCIHVRRTGNARGSVFMMCAMAASDPRYQRYPPQPIGLCPAFAEDGESGAGAVDERRPRPSSD